MIYPRGILVPSLNRSELMTFVVYAAVILDSIVRSSMLSDALWVSVLD